MLSAREQQVAGVMLIWPGQPDKVYAKILKLTERTIKVHKQRIRIQLQVAGYEVRSGIRLLRALESYARHDMAEQLPLPLQFAPKPKQHAPKPKHRLNGPKKETLRRLKRPKAVAWFQTEL